MASGEGNKQKQKRNLNSTCSSRGREWTQNEMVLFAKIMVNFTGKRRFSDVDSSMEKLRRKYTNLKQKWREISDRIKHGSGLNPNKEPGWYKYLNPIFSKTNEDIELTSEKADLSFKGDYTNYNSPSSDEDSANPPSEDSADDNLDNDGDPESELLKEAEGPTPHKRVQKNARDLERPLPYRIKRRGRDHKQRHMQRWLTASLN